MASVHFTKLITEVDWDTQQIFNNVMTIDAVFIRLKIELIHPPLTHWFILNKKQKKRVYIYSIRWIIYLPI